MTTLAEINQRYIREIPDSWFDETIRMYYGAGDKWVTLDTARRLSAKPPAITAERIADELMARIERDGAIHKSSLIEVLSMLGVQTQGSGA